MRKPLVLAAAVLVFMLAAASASAQVERDVHSREHAGYTGVSRDIFTRGRTEPGEQAAPEAEFQVSPYLLTTAMVISFSVRVTARDVTRAIAIAPVMEEAAGSAAALADVSSSESTADETAASELVDETEALVLARDMQETVADEAGELEPSSQKAQEQALLPNPAEHSRGPLKLNGNSFGEFPDSTGGTPHDTGDAGDQSASVKEQVDQPDFLAEDPGGINAVDQGAAGGAGQGNTSRELSADGKGSLAFGDGGAFALPDGDKQANLALPGDGTGALANLGMPDWATIRIPHSVTTLSRGNHRKRQVALTFDDGPHPEYTPQILKILDYYHVPATFFVVGIQCVKYPQLVQQAYAEGHEIGSHSYDHFRLPNLPEDEKEYQIDEEQLLIKRLCGVAPRFLRPPGGQIDDQTKAMLRKRGIILALWDVALNDTKDGKTADEMLKTAEAKIRPGSVILAHDGIEATVKLLPQLIEELRSQGYEFVTMSQLAAGL